MEDDELERLELELAEEENKESKDDPYSPNDSSEDDGWF